MKLGLYSFNVLLGLGLLVRVAEASGGDAARRFVGVFNDVILFPLIILMMSIAILWFLYGGFEYVMRSDNDSARETGRQHMLWGLIGLLVMVSAMTILEIAANSFGLTAEFDNVTPR